MFKRKMAFEWIYLAALFGLAHGQILCPEPEDLLPCTCDYEGVNCMKAKSNDEIKEAFKAVFPYKGITSVWIQGTPITKISRGMFGNIKIRNMYIEVNEITTVDLKAFKASTSQLMSLSLFGNKLVDFPYSGLKEYTKLTSLNLGRNFIQTIPKDAFESTTLQTLILAQNQIKDIGANAFANLPYLSRLELAQNEIVSLGSMSLAFNNHASDLEINLRRNKISSISSSAFQGAELKGLDLSGNKLKSLKRHPFESLVMKVGGKEGKIAVLSNPLSCSGCDYSWIVVNKKILANILSGFKCIDGSTLQDLSNSKIDC